jgi:hypothetical protein
MMRWTIVFMMAIVVARPAAAESFVYGRVVQSGDSPSGSTDVFTTNFPTGFAAIWNGQVVFNGQVNDGIANRRGFYSGFAGGSTTPLVSIGDAIPGGGGATFQDFGTSPAIGSIGFAFVGYNAATSATLQGIYLRSGNLLSVIADSNTAVPGGLLGNFTGFSSGQILTINGSTVAFRATFTGGSGIYMRYNGTLITTADTTMAIPNGMGNFSTLSSNQSVSGSNVAFRASGASMQQGIYFKDLTNLANPLIRVTDKTQILPGTVDTIITNMNDPAVTGNDVYAMVRAATGTDRIVRYAWNGSNSTPAFASTVIAEFGGAAPGPIAGSTFTTFPGFISADAGRIAFQANYNDGGSRSGIFLYDGTTLHNVINNGPLLDGKVVSSFLWGSNGLSGDTLTFTVFFADSTRGIYTATFIPEPTLLMGLAVIAVPMLRRRIGKVVLPTVETDGAVK